MTWKLWLDDQLDDPHQPQRQVPEGFLGARSTKEAVELLRKHGPPSFMDLDHDLGRDDRAIDFLHWLYEMFPNGPVPEYNVHSENPVSWGNITSYLESWKRSLAL